MTLPLCSDLARRGYTIQAIEVIQESDKCTDEIETSQPATPAQNAILPSGWNAFIMAGLPFDPWILLGLLLGVTLAFGSRISSYFGVPSQGGRGQRR